MERTKEQLQEELRAVQERESELQRIVNQVDDVLVVNWVGPRKDGDYRKALSDLVQAAIGEHEFFELEKAQERGSVDRLETYDETQAELSRLRAELAEAKRDIDEDQREHDALMEYARTTKGSRDVHSVYEVLDSLKRERDAAREDGARLDWLAYTPLGWGMVYRGWSGDAPFPQTLRAAIDAARKGGPNAT